MRSSTGRECRRSCSGRRRDSSDVDRKETRRGRTLAPHVPQISVDRLYNRSVQNSIRAAAVAGLFIALLSGCKKDIQNNDAVKQGVMNYLSKRQDLLAMDVAVTNVSYRDNEATATVHFQAKSTNGPGSGMDMQYVLQRTGNQWVVKGRAGENPHGANMGQPQGAPGGTGGSGSIGAMPNTAPPSGGQLPPGHPTVPPKQK